jgi:hypothetical protein
VDDFYIYYESEPDTNLVGVIKAVAPIQLKELADMDFIRVPSETGLSFTRGTTPLSRWVVKWNSNSGKMQLVQQNYDAARSTSLRFLEAIPTRQKKAQVTVTWKPSENSFNVRTRGVSIEHPNTSMVFFVTRLDDPNILYHNFTVPLLDTMQRKGYDLLCDAEIPKKFSVYTKHELDRYQLRIER